MPWTDITRAEHSRKFARYPSDLTDSEWVVIPSGIGFDTRRYRL